jgi:hypothetical protein
MLVDMKNLSWLEDNTKVLSLSTNNYWVVVEVESNISNGLPLSCKCSYQSQQGGTIYCRARVQQLQGEPVLTEVYMWSIA